MQASLIKNKIKTWRGEHKLLFLNTFSNIQEVITSAKQENNSMKMK